MLSSRYYIKNNFLNITSIFLLFVILTHFITKKFFHMYKKIKYGLVINQ